MADLSLFNNLKVLKRDGRQEVLNIDNIRKQTKLACEGLNVSEEEFISSAKINFYDNIPTREIQELLIKTASDLIAVDRPDYTFVGARLKLYDLYHSIKHVYGVQGSGDVYKKVSIQDYFDKFGYTLGDFYKSYTKEEIEEINSYVDGEKDLLFNLPAVYVLMNQYLNRTGFSTDSKHVKEKAYIVELPQHMLITMSMFNCQFEKKEKRLSIIKEQYEFLSNQYIIAASPQMSNGRIKNGSVASCLVTSAKDNIESISRMFQLVMFGSKLGAGWGVDISRIRSLGSPIGMLTNASKGKVRLCKVIDAITTYIDQGGRRNGAVCTSITSFDIDLKQYLDMRKQQGDVNMRAHNINMAVNVDDVFMERLTDSIENNVSRTYTQFDPYDVPELLEVYGEEFKKKYEEHEKRFLTNPELYNPNTEVVDVKVIARWMIEVQLELGFPYVTFIDTVNRANPHPEFGRIRTGNLCQEVMLPAEDNQIAVCNLGSVNFARINGDEDLLRKAVRVLGRFLDNSIDTTTYPHPFAEETQMLYRANGMGVMGESEYIARNKIHFGSDEHMEVIDRLYGIMDEETRKLSKELAEEKGSCGVPGERNAYRMCIAPNTSTGLFASTTSGCEPAYGHTWVEKKGQVPSVTMTAPGLTLDNWDYYKDAFNIDQYKMIDATARRQKYVDMSISHSFFLDLSKGLNGLDLLKLYIYAWKKGLKSAYYVRSKVKRNEDLQDVQISCSGCAN